jgi:glycosyltransferase involved in cell wall biosynthesis
MGDFGVIYRDERIRSKVCAPIKLGEYLACGLPVLAMSEIGDTDSIILDYNVGVIIKDENELLNDLGKIIELTSVPNIKLKCRKAAEQRLSLATSANKYYNIYSNLI